MQERLHAFILAHQLISPNDHIFAAVSGGIDSMVMLDLLRRLSEKIPFRLHIVHINHGVRGEESDADEALVGEQAGRFNLPVELKVLSDLDSNSSEDEMRNARYAAFEDILLRNPAAKIATAHHLNDQLETFLMRLAKGAGLKGLSAIPVKRERFIRPLLAFRRKEIEAYAAQNHIPFREDHTNADVSKLRNHIRHTLVPAFNNVFGDSFFNGFNKSLEEIQKHQLFFTEGNKPVFEDLVKLNKKDVRLKASDYSGFPALRRRAVFQYCISHMNPLTSHVSDNLWQAFDRFVNQASTGGRFQAGADLFVLKNREYLLFYREKTASIQPVELFVNMPVRWGEYEICLQREKGNKIILNNDRDQEFFCADQVLFPLTVRSWQEGDFFYPLGMKGKKKLSDFFVDQKMEVRGKNKIPLVCSGADILWVAGMRLDNRFRVNEKCKKIYHIKIENKGSDV